MKLPKGVNRFSVKLVLDFHPDIHPDDAEAALRARWKRSERRNILPNELAEEFFLMTLANKRPWSEAQVRQIAELSSDRKFCEKFARALEEGKSRILDPADVFILRNWRTLRGPDPRLAKLPGLNEWSPKAAAALLVALNLTGEKKGEERWYAKRRERLGLKGKGKYRVHEFIPDGSKFAVHYD